MAGPKPKDPRARFATKYVIVPSGCWIWTAGKKGDKGKQYGKFYLKELGDTGAHQASYFLHWGPIAEGMWVLHKCDVPLCVNPEHLFLGTQQDNVTDMVVKGRQVTRPLNGEENGNAKLTWEQIEVIRNSKEFNTVLAKEYGVTGSLIGQIRRGSIWRSESAIESKPQVEFICDICGLPGIKKAIRQVRHDGTCARIGIIRRIAILKTQKVLKSQRESVLAAFN